MESYYLEIGLYAVGGLILLYIITRLIFGRKGEDTRMEALKAAHEEGAITKKVYHHKLREHEKEEAEKAHREDIFERKKAALERARDAGSLTKSEFIRQMYLLDKERRKK